MQKITFTIVVALSLFILMVLPQGIVAAESGKNEQIDVENTPISSISHNDVSVDGVDFKITLNLDNEAAVNGTGVEIWTQICINSGICYDPVWHCEEVDGERCKNQLTKSEDNVTWEVTVIPDETHTYVNYKVKLVYPDDSNELFSSGKVWSDCWVYGEESGGECGNSIPTVGIVSVVTVALIAAIIRKH